jgi:flagellar hook-length control protein FliK
MLSINTNNNFSEKSNSEDTSAKDETSDLENIFASMFSVFEDPMRTNASEGSEAIQTNTTGLVNQSSSNNPKNILTETLGQESKLEKLSDSDLMKIYENYKNIVGEPRAGEKTFALKFDLLSEQNNPEVAKVISNSTSTPLAAKNKHSKFGNEAVELENYKAEKNLFEKLKIKDELQAQINSRKIVAPQDSSLSKTSIVDLKNSKASKNKNTSGDQSETYLSKNFVKQLNPNSNVITKENMMQGSQLIEDSVDTKSTKVDVSTDFSTTNTKQSLTNKNTAQQPNILNNTSNAEAQLKMLEKNWGSNLAKIVENALKEGREKIDIQLDPQKLGRLTVSLSMNNNQTSIVVNTDNTAAALLLNGAEERLSQMFEASGLKLTNFQANANGNNNSQDHTKQKNEKAPKTKTEAKTDTDATTINENATTLNYNNKRNINIIA